MKFSMFCFALFLICVFCEHSFKVYVTEHHQCIVNVSGSLIEKTVEFNSNVKSGKKIVYIQIHYNSKQASALGGPISDDYFANPNEYMWLYDGDEGLPVYMNAPYNFHERSLYILDIYITKFKVTMTASNSCHKPIVSRVDFLRLVFHQVIQIVSNASLPDNKATASICYDINNKRNLTEYSFRAYQLLGMNQNVLLRHCCKVKDYRSDYNKSIDLCEGKTKSTASNINLQIIASAILLSYFPLLLGFISAANLNHRPQTFSIIRSISNSLEQNEHYFPPFETDSSWISEHKSYYSLVILVQRLLLFKKRSAFATRIRRSFAVISSLFVIFTDLFLVNIAMKERLESYLENNIPLGYISMFFGYEKSAANTGNFFGGPYVWFSAFLGLGLIIINIPNRLCETIAYSTLHQQKTETFLIQDISLLQCYGSLKYSNLHDYDLLYAILKASLLTALNPSFWYAVIKRWFDRCKGVYNYFNRSQVIFKFIGVCVIFLCSLLFIIICASELLLCVIYYGSPVLQIFKALPHSYTFCYIWPLIKHRSLRRKSIGLIGFLLSMPIYLFIFLFGIHLFGTTFQLLNSYILYTVIALVSKPDTIAVILLLSMIIFFLVAVVTSISETYIHLQKLSITLAQKVCKDFVYTKLGERFIYRPLFERIVQEHHPVRFEIAKALIKLAVGFYILASVVYSFQNIHLNTTTSIKIGILIFTSMIPKFMSVLKDTMWKIRWDALAILETIYIFQQETNFPNNQQMINSIQ